MAHKDKIIRNPQTGQDIRFIQTGSDNDGELLEMESTYNEYSKAPPAHYHPYQIEDFTVIQGELTVRMDGQIQVFHEGDTLHIPRNKVHAMWNNSNEKTIVNWKVQPAMNTAQLLETFMGLASDGKADKEGRPPILQSALTLNKHASVFRLAKPPYPVQKVVFTALSPIAYLLGYRPTYKKYLD